MEPLDATIASSPDIVAENIAKLRELFPECFTEGSDEDGPRFKVDFDALKETLGDYVEDKEERYSFTWNGKARARRIAQTPSTGTLRPCPDESVNWDTTQNLFIEGDNLEVLKLLQKSYHRRVKMIYIDPPYNTGNEFIYPDKFQDNLDTYLRYTGQVDDEGLKLSPNSESSGRYHTNWLNMMLPRLKLARNLLSDNGVLFVSIDDHEYSRLLLLAEEVFGAENYIGTFVWQSKKGGGSDNRAVVVDSEYVLCFVRDRSVDAISKILLEAEPLDQVDQKGPYRRGRELNKWGSNSRREDRPTMYFPIPGPNGEDVYPIRNDGTEGCWRWGRNKMKEVVEQGNVEYSPRGDGTYIVYEQIRTVEPRLKPYRTWLTDTGTTADGSTLVRRLFDGRKVFDFPKPLGLLQHLCEIGTQEDGDIVLDYFAGSCSTGDAVIRQSADDGISRRFVMVQLPEAVEQGTEAAKAGYSTLADLGKERLRRAIKEMTAAQSGPGPQPLLEGDSDDFCDLGFRAYRLCSSNIKAWDADFEQLEDAVYDATDSVKADRSQSDLLNELLLKFGLDLCVPIEEREIESKAIYSVGAGALVVCLDQAITLEVVEGIAALKEELQPEVMRVVFRDSGFKDDVVKTNAVQILKQAGLSDEHIRSI